MPIVDDKKAVRPPTLKLKSSSGGIHWVLWLSADDNSESQVLVNFPKPSDVSISNVIRFLGGDPSNKVLLLFSEELEMWSIASREKDLDALKSGYRVKLRNKSDESFLERQKKERAKIKGKGPLPNILPDIIIKEEEQKSTNQDESYVEEEEESYPEEEEESTQGYSETSLSSSNPAKIENSQTLSTTSFSSSREKISMSGSSENIPRVIPRVPSMTIRLPTLDQSENNMTSFPTTLFEKDYLTRLTLSKNFIPSIPVGLSKLTNLSYLDLSHNRIQAIPSDLCDLQYLTTLNLTGNRIAAWPSTKEMEKLTALTEVFLSQNRIRFFPIETTYLPALEILDLSHNNISYLPIEIKFLTSLKNFNISHNNINTLPKQIGFLENLSKFDLSSNEINRIPAAISFLTNLTELYASHNQLTSLPDEMAVLIYLTKLDVSFNQITSIQANLFSEQEITEEEVPRKAIGLESLMELRARNNRITTIDDKLFKHQYLELLDLNHNQISLLSPAIQNCSESLSSLSLGDNRLTALPTQICTLKNLTHLNLFGNRLSTLPSDFVKLTSLKRLILGYNNLSQISFSDEWESLIELFLSGNQFKEFPSSLLKVISVQDLYFANNLIKTVPPLSPLINLVRLDLAHNQLTEFPNLQECNELLTINVSQNSIKTLPKDNQFSQMLGLADLDLQYNQIDALPDYGKELEERGVNISVCGNPVKPISSSRFKIGWSELFGRRPNMEDAFILQPSFMGDSSIDLFGVFDGHAGSETAQFASTTFPKILASKMANVDEENFVGPADFFQSSLSETNEAYRTQTSTVSSSKASHSGSTGLITLLFKERIILANIGDTRAVLSRNGKAIRLSFDHKPLDDEDRINALGGWVITGTSNRINGLLAVSRSIGDFYLEPFVSCEAFITEEEMDKNDDFLILACDGVWDELSDQQAVDIVASHKSDLFLAATSLRDHAFCAGSDDNISVIIISLKR